MDIDFQQLSTDKLIKLALTEDNDLIVNQCIITLEYRGNYEVLEKAKKLCKSDNIQEKYLGIEILGQLGIPKRAFPDESLNIFLDLLKIEINPEIIGSVAIALGHLHDQRVIQPLVRLKNHPHSEVRYGVVHGLLYHENKEAIDTLIELSSDINEDIRNWATFGLGSQIDTNTNSIREALWQRVRKENKDTDISYEIYGEALVGLAKRKDTKIIEVLLKELNSDCVSELTVEAAAEIADYRLYSTLVNLKEWWDCNFDLLEEAIHNSSKRNEL